MIHLFPLGTLVEIYMFLVLLDDFSLDLQKLHLHGMMQELFIFIIYYYRYSVMDSVRTVSKPETRPKLKIESIMV